MNNDKIKVTFAFAITPVLPRNMTSADVVAEFGPVTNSHLLLAILLMKDYIATISDVGRDLFIDDLEKLVITMKSMKHSNAFDTIRKVRE